MKSFELTYKDKTNGKLPSLPFAVYAEKILGKAYKLSVAVVSKKDTKLANTTYRGVSKPTDILSFPYTKKEGEILLCIPEIKKKAKLFKVSYQKYTLFLFIHGLLHLKGLLHGSRMEGLERAWCKKFGLTDTSAFHTYGTNTHNRH